MNVIELERHQDRITAGAEALRHLRYVVVTRSQHSNLVPPTYTVWLSARREVGESRFCLTQTQRLGFAAQMARAAAAATEDF